MDGQGDNDSSQGRQAQLRERVRVCQVCDDKALAHHFGALTCESCKAFFRRNARRKAHCIRPCQLLQTCEIDKLTRRLCPWCRLKKCVDVGMNADLIFDDDQKMELKEKVKQTREKRQARHHISSAAGLMKGESSPCLVSGRADNAIITVQDPLQTSSGHLAAAVHPTPSSPHTLSNQASSNLQTPSHVQTAANSHTSSDLQSASSLMTALSRHASSQLKTPSNLPTSSSSLQTNLKRQMSSNLEHKNLSSATSPQKQKKPGSSGEPFCLVGLAREQKKAPTVDVTKLTADELPSDPEMFWHLSEEQRCQLTALSAAYKDTLLSCLRNSQTLPSVDFNTLNVQEFVNDYEAMARNCINFVKRLDDFRSLDMDDQIACFKSSLRPVISLRNSYIFVPERNSWLMTYGELSVDVLRKWFSVNPYIDCGMELSRELKTVAKDDVTLFALLHCILLYNPGGEMVSNRQLVSVMRNKYLVLFRHYLEATFSFLYSEDYARLLLNKLVEIRDLHRAGKEVGEDVKSVFEKDEFPFECSQLLQELKDVGDC